MKPKNNSNNNNSPTSTVAGCRSLVCDSNGIIVAENVFRCMLCSSIFDSIADSKRHYYQFHVDDDDDEDLREVKQQVTQSRSTLSQAHPTVVKALTYASSDAVGNGSQAEKSSSPDPPAAKVIDEAEGNTEVAVGKAGHVKCAVCGVIRFYSCVYRRYGHFTCQVCYRFFRTFFTKPKRFFCPNLGLCKLNVRVRCRACWLLSCINLYAVDENRRATIEEYYPRETEEPVLSPGVPSNNFSVSLPRELSPLSQSPPPAPASPVPLAIEDENKPSADIESGPLVIDDGPQKKKLKPNAGKAIAAKEIKTSFTSDDFNHHP